MEKIYLHLAEGFEEIEALTVVDILRRAKLDVVVVSTSNDLYVKGSHCITVRSDMLIKDVDYEKGNMIILPGGMPGTTNLKKCDILIDAIVKYNSQNKYIAAICAAPSILGELLILKNKKAIAYPSFEDKLIGAIITDEKVVRDANIITSKSVGTAIDFSLCIVEILKSKELACELAKSMIV